MAEQTIESLPALGSVGGAVAPGSGDGSGAGRNALGWEYGAEVPILTRESRPWGEPIRCEECGRPCGLTDIPKGGALGRYRCHVHRNQPSGMVGEPCMPRVRVPPKRESKPPSIPAVRAAIPLQDPIPVVVSEPKATGTATPSLRERLRARHMPDRGEG